MRQRTVRLAEVGDEVLWCNADIPPAAEVIEVSLVTFTQALGVDLEAQGRVQRHPCLEIKLWWDWL